MEIFFGCYTLEEIKTACLAGDLLKYFYLFKNYFHSICRELLFNDSNYFKSCQSITYFPFVVHFL